MKKHIKTWDQIQDDFDRMNAMSCKPSFNKLKTGTVIDEEKSVKWNREQVELNNQKYQEEVKRLNTIKNKARDEVYESIYERIAEDVGHGITKQSAIKIWNYAFEYGHAFGFNDIKIALFNVIDLIKDILKDSEK